MNKVDEYIQAIAEKLGVAAEHVYSLLVKQQLAEGIFTISIFAFFFIVAVSFVVHVSRKGFLMKDCYSGKEIDGSEVINYIRGAMLAVSGLTFLVILMCIPEIKEGVLQLINPEYYAIKEIMDVFKSES